MTREYQDLHRTADKLQFRFRDYLDEPNDPEARALFSALEQFREQVEMEKNPRTLEDIAQRLAEEFRNANSRQVTFMSSHHLSEFYQEFESIIHHLRKFENY
jgi:ketosteroid isomerase-like protein